MENPFKTIITNEKLPETIKQKVMDDVALVKLTLNVAELVSVKYPKTIGSILSIGKNTSKKNPKKKD
ncbi:hypothetical protein [Chishuiella sp.]|uniref:hypothetical protein n=1 Tax=Chishuiella sp. TaxID=1969467 RepID=UPI0028A6BD09|nr:hypothetical protein [Chishuiella sp.]